MSQTWMILGAVAVIVWAGADGIVRIIRAAKEPGKRALRQIEASQTSTEESVESLRAELESARERIEVLERLATDSRENLRREIDDL